MKKILLLILFVFLFSGCAKKNSENISRNQNETVLRKIDLKINNVKIKAEVADTSEIQKKGLSGRKSLCDNCGMLFTFDNYDIYPFWMKGMNFPIDIIWIKDDSVVEVVENAQIPSKKAKESQIPSYTPSKKANRVLEVNAGFCQKNKIYPGVKFEFKKGDIKEGFCEKMYDEIENDLEKANYCQKDNDCDVIMLGGEYIRFGCYHFINKNENKNEFYEKMKKYNKQCFKMINKCKPKPKAKCLEGKCVSGNKN